MDQDFRNLFDVGFYSLSVCVIKNGVSSEESKVWKKDNSSINISKNKYILLKIAIQNILRYKYTNKYKTRKRKIIILLKKGNKVYVYFSTFP